MKVNSLDEIIQSNDRFKLYVMTCHPDKIMDCIAYLKLNKVNVLNIGLELASFIDSLTDFNYLNIEVFDFVSKLLEKNKAQPENDGNPVIAIYNLGILLEPQLELKAVQLFKEYSKSTALIIVWENESDPIDRLYWPTQQNEFFLDFSELHLKKWHYEI